MRCGSGREKFLLEQLRIQPRPARLVEQGEIVRHALKFSPQEQLVAALEFFTLKPSSCNASI